MATNALDHSNPRTIASAMIIALAVTIASLLVTVAVVASLQLGASSATQPGSGVPLGLQDDYALRHAVTAPALGSQDDYALRHAVTAPALGSQDDYALRHSGDSR